MGNNPFHVCLVFRFAPNIKTKAVKLDRNVLHVHKKTNHKLGSFTFLYIYVCFLCTAFRDTLCSSRKARTIDVTNPTEMA